MLKFIGIVVAALGILYVAGVRPDDVKQSLEAASTDRASDPAVADGN